MSKPVIFNVPSVALATPDGVHIDGPDGVDVTMTPRAALETAKRIGDAAVDAITQVCEKS